MNLNELLRLAESDKGLARWIESFGPKSGLAMTTEKAKCWKCGGQGGSNAWRHTGWTCFRCGGLGVDPSHVDLLFAGEPTDEFVIFCKKKAATRQKRRDNAEAKRVAKEKAEEEAFQAKVEGSPVIKEAFEIYDELNEFGKDVVATIRRRRSWTEKQEAALAKNIEFSKKAKARREKREAENAKSDFVGEVKERLELTLTVTKIMAFDSQYGTTWMILMKDGDSNLFKWMASCPSEEFEEGATVTMKATVKDHAVYKRTKQTVLTRCKALAVA